MPTPAPPPEPTAARRDGARFAAPKHGRFARGERGHSAAPKRGRSTRGERGRFAAPERGRSTRGERGQASVELVALLPLLAVVVGLLWQAVIAGQAIWLAGTAARAAARAHALGEDARAAARATLPRSLATATIVDAPPGEPTVTIRIPIPSIVGATRLATVTAHASLEAQR